MRKIVSILFALVLALTLVLVPVQTAKAADISGTITYTPSGSTVGTYVAASSTVCIFDPTTAITAGSTITLTFPAETALANIIASDFTIEQAASGTSGAGAPTAPTIIASDNVAKTITFTVAAGSLSSGGDSDGKGVVTIKTSGTAGGNEIRHPTTATTTGAFSVDTSVGDTGTINNVVFVHDAANQLVVTQQPAGSVSGVALTTQPGVEARDQFGNRDTTYGANITAAENDPGTLAGLLSVPAAAGSANFTNLAYTATADHEIFQIDFTSGALAGATSNDVNCNVVATKLVFTQQPAGSVSGFALATQPIVAAQDADNVTDADYVTNVTAAEDDPGALTGTLIVGPVAGVATFTDLVYTATVDNEIFQIDVTSGGLAGATSNDVICTFPVGGGGGASTASGSGSMNLASYLSSEGRSTANINLNSTDGLVTVGIPAGTLVLNAQGTPLGNIQIVTLSTPPPPPDCVLVGHAYDCLPDGANFQPDITLTFKYAEADIPDGVNEQDLVLAYWDGNQWLNLATTVNLANNTVTAEVAHFTPFAILAYLGTPAFATSDLSITPAEVDIGGEVTISLLVANTGDAAGSYEVTIEIDSVAVATEEVTLAAGASKTVTFTTAKDVAGAYAVSVGDLSGTFVVKEAAPEGEGAKPLNPWVVAGIIAAVIVAVLIVVMLVRRRA